jgi:hypothetical protein
MSDSPEFHDGLGQASPAGVSPFPVTFPLFTKRERSAARALMSYALCEAHASFAKEARLAALLLRRFLSPGPSFSGGSAQGGAAAQLAPSARWPTTTGGRVSETSHVPACEAFPRAPHPAPTSDRIATRPRGTEQRLHTRSLLRKASAHHPCSQEREHQRCIALRREWLRV